MRYILSLLGYGDCLITGSIIENKRRAVVDVRLIGTRVSAESWSVLHAPIEPDEIILNNIPAFYVIKSKSLAKAYIDFRKTRAWVINNVQEKDTVIFEKAPDLRNRLIMSGVDCEIVEIERRGGAYYDRSKALAPYYGLHQWPDCERLLNSPKTVLINPDAREVKRQIHGAHLYIMAKAFKKLGARICLLDYNGAYRFCKDLADDYVFKPTLKDAVSVLKSSDFYIGPDSFFTHLAYYLKVPQLAFFWKDNTYFEPPGLSRVGGVFYFDDLRDHGALEKKISLLFK